MRHFIEIISTEPDKDSMGFAKQGENVIAKVRAQKETRSGNESKRNNATFSTVGTVFRFRTIPDVTVTTANFIRCGKERFNIMSVNDVRGMYWDCACEKVEPSKG
jgi:hypothetical protein